MMSIGMVAQEQRMNPIHVAVPSLNISPDARGGGMGDLGAATTPDVYSQYWNPAKYPFVSRNKEIAFSYTPWMRKIMNDVALMNVASYFKIGSEDNQAISASFTYFSLGDVDMRDGQGIFMGTVAPSEFAIDLGYSRKLTQTFSMGVVLRYIRADYSNGENDLSAGNAFSADIAGYNESYLTMGDTEAMLGLGFNISNIGTKMSMNDIDGVRFIPTNLRLGASLMYPIDDKHNLSASVDLNKLLVPTPPDPTAEDYDKKYQDYINTSSIGGIFKSFGDAPFSEELKEINWSVGAEYNYDNMLKLRTGYHNEASFKGNRKHVTFGVGFRYSAFQLDGAYILGTSSRNPLDQSFRLSLSFDIDKLVGFF